MSNSRSYAADYAEEEWEKGTISKSPLQEKQITIWDILKKKYKWIAMDDDGKWYGYESEPIIIGFIATWDSEDHYMVLDVIKNKYLPKIKKKDWKQSKFKRGETW
jgi:hypothetical protein